MAMAVMPMAMAAMALMAMVVSTMVVMAMVVMAMVVMAMPPNTEAQYELSFYFPANDATNQCNPHNLFL